MKKTLLVIAFMLLSSAAFAAPFIVCDPQEGVIGYDITGLPGGTVSYIAQADGSIKYDLAAVQNGTYELTVAACNIWGCGDSVPFQFSKQVPSAPAGLRIVAD